MKHIKPVVFWPPFLLLFAAVVLNFINKDVFTSVVTNTHSWVLDTFGWLFTLTASIMLAVCACIYFSPFGRVIIGGPDAKPLLTRWRWFTIILCTTIAIGILSWAVAEPMFFLSDPPTSLGIEPESPEAVTFTMDSVFYHWTFTPYAIYAVGGLMFAFAFYNMKKPFSLGSMLAPLQRGRPWGTAAHVIDAICLYTLVIGMAGSLGGAMMVMAGGIDHMSGIGSGPFVLAIIAALIVGTFTISAVSGLMKGIRILSNINTYFLVGLLVFVLVVGPTRYIISQGSESFLHFVANYLERSWWTTTTNDPWVKNWTIFYWGSWFAWAPISVAFLGRIAYGHSVRAFLIFNLVLPATFTGLWMTVFGTTAIDMQLSGKASLVQVLNDSGYQSVLYAFLEYFPAARITIPIFLITAFLSYVTASDSNTSAMSGLCSTGISPENPESSMHIKILWGVMIGFVSWIMVSFAGLDGLRMLNSLGGFPAMFLCIGVTVCLVLVAVNPRKYDTFKEGYDQQGRPIRK